jgi:hypothetical protein
MYLDLMNNSLTKQDQYIRDIIDYSRNKRKQRFIKQLSLNTLIKNGIAQNQFAKIQANRNNHSTFSRLS